eukprot:CAMPEP_0194151308 /NCGR_PEP_ID=MMETSP0152-20130528/47584_1 /TAXON_ID=1049557 /ORGANISM="Thalassiothrix antarctica, Strain L6-D1" /LENGTH=488 /DNA_ID=CAMNT_0038855007 /DNA_START=53 /DNA_END=1519 /DNA_ORIENTATION=-
MTMKQSDQQQQQQQKEHKPQKMLFLPSAVVVDKQKRFTSRRVIIDQFLTSTFGNFSLKGIFPVKTKDYCSNNILYPNTVCSVSSLSLISSSTEDNDDKTTIISHDKNDDDKYHEAEESAVTNLACPIFATAATTIVAATAANTVEDTKKEDTRTTDTSEAAEAIQFQKDEQQCSPSLELLPLNLLSNVSESFLILINARLRAYIKILMQHGINLEEEDNNNEILIEHIEKKITTLTKIGKGITIEKLALSFETMHEESDNVHTTNNSMTEEEEFPLTMKMTIDVSIPSNEGGDILERISLSNSARGIIKASFNNTNKPEKVNIEIDTQTVLYNLIDHASHITAKTLETMKSIYVKTPSCQELNNNNNNNRKRRFLDEERRFLYKERHNSGNNNRNIRSGSTTKMITMMESDEEDECTSLSSSNSSIASEDESLLSLQEEVIEKLSPQSCAHIVDSVFIDDDDSYYWSSSSCSEDESSSSFKRQKRTKS